MYIYYINFEGEQTMNILTRFACAAVLTFAVGAMMPAHADAAAVDLQKHLARYPSLNLRCQLFQMELP